MWGYFPEFTSSKCDLVPMMFLRLHWGSAVSLGRGCPRWAGAWDGDARRGLEKRAVVGAPPAIDSGVGE